MFWDWVAFCVHDKVLHEGEWFVEKGEWIRKSQREQTLRNAEMGGEGKICLVVGSIWRWRKSRRMIYCLWKLAVGGQDYGNRILALPRSRMSEEQHSLLNPRTSLDWKEVIETNDVNSVAQWCLFENVCLAECLIFSENKVDYGFVSRFFSLTQSFYRINEGIAKIWHPARMTKMLVRA